MKYARHDRRDMTQTQKPVLGFVQREDVRTRHVTHCSDAEFSSFPIMEGQRGRGKGKKKKQEVGSRDGYKDKRSGQ
jgi:hypothetical protein